VGATGETTWRHGASFCTNLHVREEAAAAVVWRFSLAARLRSVAEKRMDGV
jgi:hypothetical protein